MNEEDQETVRVLRLAQEAQGDMTELRPITASEAEEKGSKGRIDVVAGARKKSKLELHNEREKLKKDFAIPLDKEERKSLMEREDDV